MMALYVLIALVAALTTSLSAFASNLAIFESVSDTGLWLRDERATPSATLVLQIKLNQERAGEFEQHVIDISTPGHELYGRHLSREQVHSFVRPSNDSIEKVLNWIVDSGVALEEYHLSKTADSIDLYIDVAKAESLFNAEFYTYTNHGQTIVRSQEYSLPADLHELIITVIPIIRYPGIAPHMSMIWQTQETSQQPTPLGYDPEFCNHTITPTCLQGLYQMDNFTAPQGTGTILGVSGFLNQTALLDDLHDFIAAYAPYSPQVFPDLLATDNSTLPDSQSAVPRDTMEASLDLQYTSAMAPGIGLSWYSTFGLAEAKPDLDTPINSPSLHEPFVVQLTYLLNVPDDELPSVLSTSYGENEQAVPMSYRNLTCSMFAQLAARGVSVIFSSGDTGPGSSCTKNDHTERALFNPIFPATCPYVTSVGGTTGVEPERAARFSSGGFSEYWGRPHFQEKQVQEYLNNLGDTWQGLYQVRGRGFPDVAIQSTNFVIRDHGVDSLISGTSAGAPVFAGMIANLNAVRLSQDLPKLGYLNPWLYSEASEAFTDIVDGGSRGCTGRSFYTGRNATYIPYASWNATKGWDPVTGLGTPNWSKLLEIATGGGDITSKKAPVSTSSPAVPSRTRAGPWRSSNSDKHDDAYHGDGPWDSMHPRPRPRPSAGGGWPSHRNTTWHPIPPRRQV